MRRTHFLLPAAALVAMNCSGPPNPISAPPRAAAFEAVPIYSVKAPGPRNEPSCTISPTDPRAQGWDSWTQIYVKIHVDEAGVVDLVRSVEIKEGPALGADVMEALRQCASTATFENPKRQPMDQFFQLYVREL